MTDRLEAVERAVVDLLRSTPEAALTNLLAMPPDAREALVIGFREVQMKMEAMKNYIDTLARYHGVGLRFVDLKPGDLFRFPGYPLTLALGHDDKIRCGNMTFDRNLFRPDVPVERVIAKNDLPEFEHKMPPPGPMPEDFRFENTRDHRWLEGLESMPQWPADEIGDNVIKADVPGKPKGREGA